MREIEFLDAVLATVGPPVAPFVLRRMNRRVRVAIRVAIAHTLDITDHNRIIALVPSPLMRPVGECLRHLVVEGTR
jgi:hypothetical protein